MSGNYSVKLNSDTAGDVYYSDSGTTGIPPIYINTGYYYTEDILVNLDRDVVLKFTDKDIRLTPKDIKKALFKLFPTKMAAAILEKWIGESYFKYYGRSSYNKRRYFYEFYDFY